MKTVVIDTCVLINDPYCLYKFDEHDIVLPLAVIEELDNLKMSQNPSKAQSARSATREIAKILGEEDPQKGVRIPDKGNLFIIKLNDFESVVDLDSKNDNTIILTAFELQKVSSYVVFVSCDINARIKAKSLGLKSEDYNNTKVEISDQYKGWQYKTVSQEQCWELRDVGSIEFIGDYEPNEYIFLKCPEEPTIFIGKYDAELECLWHVESTLKEGVSGINPMNVEQRVLVDALLDPKVNLITATGSSGSGKTLLSIASALEQVVQQKKYKKVIITRPIIGLDSGIGYLPGDKDEKMSVWVQPFMDNLEFIMENSHKQNLKSIDQLQQNGTLEVEALTFIRGRSLPNVFMIIDEAQNLTPHEVKTILTRIGENSCIVFMGDTEQIDFSTAYMDATSNGLVNLVNRFKSEKISAHVHLTKTERSELAEKAVQLL